MAPEPGAQDKGASPEGAQNPSADWNNLAGGAWLLADMSLNIWALSLVKALGPEIPAAQVVFLRALVGLVLIGPLLWRGRALFVQTPDLRLHLLRVALAVTTLILSFYAIARLPLALFTAVGFTRPILTMLLAAWLLAETIGAARWGAAAVAFVGVLIAVSPAGFDWSNGLAALCLVVLTGSLTVIVTRRLRAAPTLVLMAFYTAGLTVASAPLTAVAWVPLGPQAWGAVLLVGVFAQCAQMCFLRAHASGEAGFLSVLSYTSLVLSVGVGFVIFGERPAPEVYLGAACVVSAALFVTAWERRGRSGP